MVLSNRIPRSAPYSWFFRLVVSVGVLLIASAIFLRSVNTEQSHPIEPSLSRYDILDARKNVSDAIEREEEKLLTVLSLQMGIVAFAATMIFGSDFSVEKPRELFTILTFLVIILALLYLHLYKGYLGTYAYAVQLESALPPALRAYQQIYQGLSEIRVHWLLRPVVSLTNTFYIISFLPVYVVIIATVGFGRKLNIRASTIWGINILTTSWAIAYLAPVLRAIAAVGG